MGGGGCTERADGEGSTERGEARAAGGEARPAVGQARPAADGDRRAPQVGALGPASESWPTYGGDPGQTRYSTLDRVDTANVAGLRPGWRYRTGVPGTFEATPVVVGGALYLSTPMRDGAQHVVKLDAATGEELWRHRIPVEGARIHPAPVHRGVAVHGGRVLVGTLDARLVALDTATGERAWERRTADASAGYAHKQAPLAWEGRVYLGASASPFGIRGRVQALDAATGREVWTWHAIPSPEEGGWWGAWTDTLPGTDRPLPRDLAAERRDSARHADAWRTGGAAVWMTPTLDPARGLLFVGTSNPAPELTGFTRPGDNLWSVSVCALRADSGRQVWCYQILPHDLWGTDVASPPILFEMERDGERVPAVGHFSKLGVFFAWHRETGELLTRSEPYVPHRNLLAAPTREGVERAPGIYGGTEWSPGAWHPGTGLLYAANLHRPGRYRLVRTASGGPRITYDDLGGREQWGNVAAVDPASGMVAWRSRTPLPMVGGVLATAGGLVFAGRLDGGLAAWHARTGEQLWHGELEPGCASAPATWEAEGRQFVGVACGGHFLGGRSGDLFVAFALPATSADRAGRP